MNCDEAGRLLEAYIDGELELTRQLDLEVHLAACATCKNAAESAIDFGSTIRMYMPIYKAPPKLKASIRAALRKECRSQLDWFSNFRRLLAIVAAIVMLGLLLAWAWIAFSHGRDQELISEAVSDHWRSLLVNHLLDITSSDQHVVRSWFTGKFSYAPSPITKPSRPWSKGRQAIEGCERLSVRIKANAPSGSPLRTIVDQHITDKLTALEGHNPTVPVGPLAGALPGQPPDGMDDGAWCG